MQHLGKRYVELVILQKVVGRLPISVGGDEPIRKGAIFIFFQDFLRFFDPFTMENRSLVIDRFDFGGEGREFLEVLFDIVCLVGAMSIEDDCAELLVR